MEMGLALGVTERVEEKHLGEERGWLVLRVRVGRAREAAEVDMVRDKVWEKEEEVGFMEEEELF